MAEETYDAAIVGAGFAGLTTAKQLARANRRTGVLDNGAPCKAPIPAARGGPGWDGTPPVKIPVRSCADLDPVSDMPA